MSPPPEPVSLQRAAFVVGSARSGTTLLRVMLAGHPRLFVPPEMVIAPFRTMAERAAALEKRWWEKGGLRRAIIALDALSADEEGARRAKETEDALSTWTVPQVYAWLQERIGNKLLVDKCPHLALEPEALRRTDGLFPDARWVWIVRHPAGVMSSLDDMPFSEVLLDGLPGERREAWWLFNHTLQEFLAALPQERWTRVRYEDLVRSPRPEMERVCATLGVGFDESVLNPYEGDRMRTGPKGARAVGDPNIERHGRIDPNLAHKGLDGFDVARVGPRTRELAAAYGYDLDRLPRPAIADARDGVGKLLATAAELSAGLDVPTELDAAEGQRFVLRMLSAAVDSMVEQAESDRPEFAPAESPTRKMFADCPDADYWRAPIRLGPGRAYRVSGRVPPGTTYAGVLLYRRGGRVGRGMPDGELGIGSDGRFAVLVSTEAPSSGGSTWLRGDGDETAVMVRQYFADRASQPPIEIRIDFLGEAGRAPPLAARDLAHRLERADRMLRTVVDRTVQGWRMARTLAFNKLVPLPGEGLFPTPDNSYRAAWFRMGADQVVFVRGRLPKARYFSATLYDAWMESLDTRNHPRACLNHSRIRADGEGRFELCLSEEPLDHPNWMDVAGHRAGYVLLRALLPEGDLGEFDLELCYRREWDARAR